MQQRAHVVGRAGPGLQEVAHLRLQPRRIAGARDEHDRGLRAGAGASAGAGAGGPSGRGAGARARGVGAAGQRAGEDAAGAAAVEALRRGRGPGWR
jgi:hypothetical protein